MKSKPLLTLFFILVLTTAVISCRDQGETESLDNTGDTVQTPEPVQEFGTLVVTFPPDQMATVPEVVALNTQTGDYVIGTFAPGSGATTEISVPVGFYQIFAFPTLHLNPGIVAIARTYFGHWGTADSGLETVAVGTAQRIEGIDLQLPADPCSPAYQVPGTSDGKFPNTGAEDYRVDMNCDGAGEEITDGTLSVPVSEDILEYVPTIIALNTETNEYLAAQIPSVEVTSLELMLPPGTYRIFGYPTFFPNESSAEKNLYFGVWADSGGLQTITVEPFSSASAVSLAAPPDVCDSIYFVPGTTDGKFKATSDPDVLAGLNCQVAEEEEPETPPAGCPEFNTPEPTGRYYTVKPCDNLYRIGLAYGLSWTAIAQANGIPNANAIYVGQVLFIPGQ